ncbi:MAG: retron St85 family RNA-directed DNA polymerase [Butyrivibrio sp.]
MNWNEYEEKYIRLAKIKGKSDNYCINQLEYAKKLFDKDLPIIYSQEHLCLLVGYSKEYVYAISNSPVKFYRTFKILKKNGKERTINEPLPSLKEIQEWILKEILEKIKVSPYSKAYVKGRSIRDNARFHKRQKKVLTMDLQDFFPSITFGRVLSVFRKAGYRENVAVMLANLCSLQNQLPQGAPTSPALSNIIASKLDYKISNFINGKEIRYTRYADDLTFSGDFKEGDIIKNIERIVNRQGFRINHNKTRVRKKNQRQEVTGIVVNDKMQISRDIRRRIRSDAYYIKKYGYMSHANYVKQKKNNYLYYLIGITSYALFVNPNDDKMREYLGVFKSELFRYKNGDLAINNTNPHP